MTRCARCQWTPTPDAGPHLTQLAGHAADAGHPLCPVPKPTGTQ